MSPLVVVCFTVERFLVVRFPLHRARICTLCKARKVLLLMLPYPPIIFTVLATTEYVDEQGGCAVKRDDRSLLINGVVQVIDIFVSCLIPLLAIFIPNALIARDLVRESKQQRAMTNQIRQAGGGAQNAREEEATGKDDYTFYRGHDVRRFESAVLYRTHKSLIRTGHRERPEYVDGHGWNCGKDRYGFIHRDCRDPFLAV